MRRLLLAAGLAVCAVQAGAQMRDGAGRDALARPPAPAPATRLGTPGPVYACDRALAGAEIRRLGAAGIVAEIGELPPNVSVVVDKRQWDRAAPPARRRWAQEVACATGERFSTMLRTVTFRARDSSLLGSFSSRDLAD